MLGSLYRTMYRFSFTTNLENIMNPYSPFQRSSWILDFIMLHGLIRNHHLIPTPGVQMTPDTYYGVRRK